MGQVANVKIDSRLHKALKHQAIEEGSTLCEIIDKLVTGYLKEKANENNHTRDPTPVQ